MWSSCKRPRWRRIFEEIARLPTSRFASSARGMPHFQLIATDATALVLQYMFSRGTADSPLQQFPAGTPFTML